MFFENRNFFPGAPKFLVATSFWGIFYSPSIFNAFGPPFGAFGADKAIKLESKK